LTDPEVSCKVDQRLLGIAREFLRDFVFARTGHAEHVEHKHL